MAFLMNIFPQTFYKNATAEGVKSSLMGSNLGQEKPSANQKCSTFCLQESKRPHCQIPQHALFVGPHGSGSQGYQIPITKPLDPSLAKHTSST